jgi:hypothetical protein
MLDDKQGHKGCVPEIVETVMGVSPGYLRDQHAARRRLAASVTPN